MKDYVKDVEDESLITVKIVLANNVLCAPFLWSLVPHGARTFVVQRKQVVQQKKKKWLVGNGEARRRSVVQNGSATL